MQLLSGISVDSSGEAVSVVVIVLVAGIVHEETMDEETMTVDPEIMAEMILFHFFP
jgi:hypothetical protein